MIIIKHPTFYCISYRLENNYTSGQQYYYITSFVKEKPPELINNENKFEIETSNKVLIKTTFTLQKNRHPIHIQQQGKPNCSKMIKLVEESKWIVVPRSGRSDK